MTGFVLHVGLPKTATTTLQATLFSGHPEICFLGKTTQYQGPRGCRSTAAYAALRPALWDQSAPFEPDRLRLALEAELGPEITSRKVVVGSWEALGGMGNTLRFGEMLRRLTRLFGSCRVMMSVRNPYHWVHSLYLQELQGNFVKRNRGEMRHRPFMEPAEWFRCRGRARLLSAFGDNLRVAVALLGRDNVGVFAYEDLVADPARYYAGICGFLGVSLDDGLALSRGQRFHLRTTEAQVAAMRAVDSSWLRRLAWQAASQPRRRMFLRQAASRVGDADRPATVALPEALRQEIAEAARGTCRWLATEFDLTLDAYGYPT